MEKVKLLQDAGGQAVRLPQEFRIPGKEVKIFRKGNQIILEPLEITWNEWFDCLSDFPEDFMADGRNQPPLQERPEF